ncbi:MAG: hypothetical protein AAFO58_12515, partial [Pseudomonadota bacterium]
PNPKPQTPNPKLEITNQRPKHLIISNMNRYHLSMVLFMLLCIEHTASKQTIELSAPNKEERELFVNPLLMAMNPMLNPMAMHFPLNSDKKYKIKHNLHVVHGPYGMNPYMMHMNPYMMGMMNPYMMGMFGGYHPYNVAHPMHPFNPMGMYGMGMMGPMGGAFLHTHAEPHDEESPDDRKLIDDGTEEIDRKMMETMEEERKDAAKGGIQLNF